MWKVVEGWVNRYLADEEAVLLLILLALALVVLVTLGEILAPFLAAVVIAFLLQGSVTRLNSWRVPHKFSVSIVFVLFVGLVLVALIFLMPLVAKQATNLVAETPRMIKQWQASVMLLPEKYPHLISQEELSKLISYASHEGTKAAEALLTFSVSKFPNLIALMVYLVLVPLMVFFMLKDRDHLVQLLSTLLPDERPVMRQIWHEMNAQIANYVRGKALEILIVGVVTFIAFMILGVNYAALLALLVGLSVVIPYIGAAVVTIPVLMVGYFQWGWSGDFMWLFVVYMVIQFLDGNVLVPLLFSEAVNLHPVAIILAVLVFGGVWGFWGVFFAIPLATLIKALYNAWPRTDHDEAYSD